MLKPKKILDYDGPTGAYAVVDGRIVPMADPAALVALTQSAMLTSLGLSAKAAEYEQLINADRDNQQ